MTVFEAPEFLNHEQVVFACDDDAGLRAIFAIHNTKRGPALGGCRLWPYEDETAALTDALRLSKGMTYKAVMADLDLGGGKVVMIGDPRRDKTPQLLQAMGRAVQRLGGRYIIAEDVGTTVGDMTEIRKTTEFVVGLAEDLGGSGDPSPTTAKGCLVGMRACAKHLWGQQMLDGARIGIQGLGNVGWSLAELLADEGATIVVSDVRWDIAQRARDRFGAEVVQPADIYDADVDIFAPCALGGVLNDETIPRLRAKVVGGAANNQLLAASHAELLQKRDVLYAPDYVINAAGMIRVASERKGFDQDWVDRKTQQISDTLLEIFDTAETMGVSTEMAARKIASTRLAA